MTHYRTRAPVLALAIAVSWAAALLGVGAGDWFDRDVAEVPLSPSPPSRWPSAVGETAAIGASAAAPRATAILRRWDRRRSRAYARGDADALGSSYAARSRAGTSDVGLLRAYRGRGLRVEGLTMQLLAVEVLDRAPGRLRLRVTDRVHGGVAVGVGTRVTLPRDEASTRTVVMRRASTAAHWTVVAVRE